MRFIQLLSCVLLLPASLCMISDECSRDIQYTWAQKIFHLKPTLGQIENCLLYCFYENEWLPTAQYFGRYDLVGECLYEQLGFHYNKESIKRHIEILLRAVT